MFLGVVIQRISNRFGKNDYTLQFETLPKFFFRCDSVVNEIRLIGNTSLTGRVKVFADGQWGTICEDGWDINDAHVICRQLGFPSAIKAFSSATHGQGSGQIWIHSLECTGNESHIYECSHNDYNCDHSGDASVECSSIIPWWHELHWHVILKGYIKESPQ